MTAIDPRSAWATLGRPLRLGVIGGGPGSFIGPIHRTAAVLDQRFVIVAGVLSSDPLRAVSHGAALGLDASRAYVSVAQMIAAESTRAAENRIEAVAVMTPNDRHYTDCVQALQAGLHVICDKPMVNTLRQARHLVELVEQTQLAFCLTHNYSGYPMVRQARAMVEAGVLGDILDTPWPQVDPKALAQDEIELVLQINGKLRGAIVVPAGASKEAVEQLAVGSEVFLKLAGGATPKKIIVVPGRLVNLVL